jgi:transcriptional regulator with XRE-family HTH domain
MDDIRVGLVFRAIRRSKHLRQIDVGNAAGLSQQLVSDLERGWIRRMTVERVRSIGAVLEIEMPFGPRWRGPELRRLLDDDHAAIVGIAVRHLQGLGWSVLVEWSFNHYGERGSVDVVAWQPTLRALAIIEVKTRIVDLQDLLATHDRKVRIGTRLLPREHGWVPRSIGRIVVVPDRSAVRAAVDRHGAVLSAVLPARTREIRRWVQSPDGNAAGIWFIPDTARGGTKRPQRGREEQTVLHRACDPASYRQHR